MRKKPDSRGLYKRGPARKATSHLDLPSTPGQYQLVDRNPNIIKRTVRKMRGRDPHVAHVGIASNLRGRVNTSHEKYEPGKQDIRFKEAQLPMSHETWKKMGVHEAKTLDRVKPHNSHLGRGGAGRTPNSARRTEDKP